MNLVDDTIRLRPFDLSDAAKHFAGEDDKQVKWLSGGKSTLENVRNWIKKNQKYWENDGPIFNFAIVDAVKNELVGMVEANTDSKSLEGVEEGEANISYGLYPSARGKGYTSRAINLLVGFLKNKGIKRAIIRVDPGNIDSLKVPERLGFSKEGKIVTKQGENLQIFVKNLT